MNRIILIGNLGKDPELTTLQSGKIICKFSLAVGRQFADADGNKGVDFFNINVWGKLGENCAKYLKKGSKCAIIGRAEINTYEKDGIKRYITNIIADEVEFLSKRESVESGANSDVTEHFQTGMFPVNDDSLPF